MKSRGKAIRVAQELFAFAAEKLGHQRARTGQMLTLQDED